MVRRRFRHLLVVLLAWIVQAIMIQILLAPMLRRPRPFGVEFRTDWTAWALPSEQMAALVVVVVGILYSLVPEGHWRQTGKWAATALVALVALAHLYVGVEAPTDILVGVAIGVVIPLLGFRWLAPQPGVAGQLPALANRAPGRLRGTWAGDPPGPARPTRAGGRRRSAVRSSSRPAIKL